jgi:hypothetical protein
MSPEYAAEWRKNILLVIAFNKLYEVQENKEIEDSKLGSTDLSAHWQQEVTQSPNISYALLVTWNNLNFEYYSALKYHSADNFIIT